MKWLLLIPALLFFFLLVGLLGMLGTYLYNDYVPYFFTLSTMDQFKEIARQTGTLILVLTLPTLLFAAIFLVD